MFGRKKDDDAGMQKAKKLGAEIAQHAMSHINGYCDRIVYFQASQILRGMTEALDDLPDFDPLDDEGNKPRAVIAGDFLIKFHEALGPLKAQLVAQIDEMYGKIFDGDSEIRATIHQYIEKCFGDQLLNVMQATFYVAGLSESYVAKLLNKVADEKNT